MRSLQPVPQCSACLMSLARDVAALTVPEDGSLAEKAEGIARSFLAEAGYNGSSSPRIANRILREIRRITGIADPYQEFKAREMEQARHIFSKLPDAVADDLSSGIKLAALGNSLDFFKDPRVALADIPYQFNHGVSFYLDHQAQLEAFLAQKPRRILYVTDNAGEIYFDIPLYDYLAQYSERTYLVVKGGPALNDLTRAELQAAGLTNRFEAVADTGTDGAGIDWDHVSVEFLRLLDSADLIISKGMANFETLYPSRITAPSFYLLKVKCEPIQNYIKAPVNSFIALWKDGRLDE